jgi:hypothetical protein
LGILGLLQGPPETNEPTQVSRNGEQGNERGDARAEPTASPSPSPKPTPTETLAQVDGVKLQINTVHGECWIDVTADGSVVFSETLPVGETRTFKADDTMSVVLGLPSSVELVVNGRNLGVPGDENPITIQLPDDIETL